MDQIFQKKIIEALTNRVKQLEVLITFIINPSQVWDWTSSKNA